MRRKAQIFLIIGPLFLAACVGRPPLRTYTIARTALDSAKRTEGAKHAPEAMHLAEESYRKGEFYYRNKDFASAADEFEKTIKYAEQAEKRSKKMGACRYADTGSAGAGIYCGNSTAQPGKRRQIPPEDAFFSD